MMSPAGLQSRAAVPCCGSTVRFPSIWVAAPTACAQSTSQLLCHKLKCGYPPPMPKAEAALECLKKSAPSLLHLLGKASATHRRHKRTGRRAASCVHCKDATGWKSPGQDQLAPMEMTLGQHAAPKHCLNQPPRPLAQLQPTAQPHGNAATVATLFVALPKAAGLGMRGSLWLN